MQKINTSKPTYEKSFNTEQKTELLHFLDILEKKDM